jgi:urea transport system substrate-binding protein
MLMRLRIVGGGVLLAVGIGAVIVGFHRRPIRVGIVHSLTGTMAISERPLVDAETLAINDLNRDGGLLGRPVVAIVVDGQSDPAVFAREVERLITKEHVSAIFGCWTSACRRTVRPVIERYHHLLFYPLQYEGLEDSPDIVYLGASASQQVLPAMKWVLGTLGPRLFLVGSDYVFPRAANEIIKDYARRWHAQIVGEEYLPLGSTDVSGVVAKIAAAHPDAILNTLNGDSNIPFFRALRSGRTAPVVSFSIAEVELRRIGPALLEGDFAAWNYFQSLDNEVNADFVKHFKETYGATRVVDDPMEASYLGVELWANGVRAAGTDEVNAVRARVKNTSLRAPEGMVYVDPDNDNTWKTLRIGRVRPDGQFDVVWTSDSPIQPFPYPPSRTQAAWDAFAQALYSGWGNRWEKPVLK